MNDVALTEAPKLYIISNLYHDLQKENLQSMFFTGI